MTAPEGSGPFQFEHISDEIRDKTVLHTYQEYYRWVSNECDGCRELAFVATRVLLCELLGMANQTQLLNTPRSHLNSYHHTLV